MQIAPRTFIIAFALILPLSLYSTRSRAQGNFEPITNDTASLRRAEQQNNQQIRMIQDQLRVYSDYLASHGQSEEIHIDRHLDVLPESVLILGGASGAVSGAIGLVSAMSEQIVMRRFFWAGAMITIFSTVAAHYLRRRADSADGRADQQMISELDNDPDPNIRESFEALMVQQLFELKERNRAIRIAIKQRQDLEGRNSPEYADTSGIIPQATAEIRTASASP